MMLVPVQSISTGNTATPMLDKSLNQLDEAMRQVLNETHLDEDEKMKKYLLMLQRFLRYSNIREDIRSRPIPVFSMNDKVAKEVTQPPIKPPKKRNRREVRKTRPVSTWEEGDELPIEDAINGSLREELKSRKKKARKTGEKPVKRLNRKLSFSPMKTRLWSSYKK